MNKDQKVLVLIIVLIVIIASVFGVYAYKHKGEKRCKTEDTDAIKFKREYEEYNDKNYDNGKPYFNISLSSKNLFKYITEEDAVKFLSEGTGVIYFGFPQCPWCRSLVPYLEEAGEKYGLYQIYYLNIREIRDSYKVEDKKAVIDKTGTESYYKLLDLLDKYLEEYNITDEKGKKYDTGVKRLYAPTTVAVKNGKIVGFNEGTVDSQEKFVALNDDEIKELKQKLSTMFAQVSSFVCTDSGC